jgi:hypothetical protein
MKKVKAQKSKELNQEAYPKTYELLKDLEELINDKEEYRW